MSYILDALKKIEHEKHKKAAPNGRVSLTGDLFHERKQTASASGIWKMAALLAVAVLVACAGTWFVLRGDSRKSRAVVRREATAPPVVATPPVMPAPVPVQAVQPQVAPVPSTISVDAKQPGTATAPSRKDRSLKKQRIPAAPPAPKQVVPTIQPLADIKLSGIAWQDERAGRRAVINGFLLKEGAVVSGAKVTDIQADRVRFSTAAGVFEIRLDGALPPEVKK